MEKLFDHDPYYNTQNTSVRLSVCLSVIMVSPLRAVQPRLAAWAGRMGDTTGRTPGLVLRRAVAIAC